MNIARRTKTIALSGLLAALTLAATGCTPEAPAGASSPAESQAPKSRTIAESVATFGIEEAPNFREPSDVPAEFHFTEAEVEDLKATSMAVLPILVEEHPEFTVEGFTPTPEIWNEQIAPKLQPLSTPDGFERMSSSWGNVLTEDMTFQANSGISFHPNAVLTNKPEFVTFMDDGSYVASSTWKSDNGEVCSPSDKPYEIIEPVITLYSEDGGTYLSARSELQMDVIVHCKEGGKLTSPVSLSAYLRHDGPGTKFALSHALLTRTPGGTSLLTK